jgi:hypothetical protein
MYAKVAQLVEHSPEKAGVTGSSPVFGTTQWWSFSYRVLFNPVPRPMRSGILFVLGNG